MSDYTVFYDVGESLKQLLADELSPLVEQKNIKFDSPAQIKENAALPCLSLFLFKVEENSHLKNSDMRHINPPGPRQPPVALDLYYLVTPFSKEKDDELRIAGRVVQIFHDNPVLRGRKLKKSLDGAGEKFRVGLYTLPFDELFQLWQSFKDEPFGLSLCYKVTPVEIDSRRELQLPRRVVEKQDIYQQKSVKKVK
jgi:hypothetical protein